METHARTADGHTDLLEVTSSTQGWEVRETRDSAVVLTRRYSDWHRVERAVQAFEWREATVRALALQSTTKL